MTVSQASQSAYVAQSRYSDPGPHTGLFDALPRDVADLCKTVQGLLIHDSSGQHLYGPAPPGFDQASRATLLVAQRLGAIIAAGNAPLTTARPPFERSVGTCRDFALLLCAMLRRQGLAARVRCGFAGYFHPPSWEDHWLCEYWRDGRWALADAQLDEAHRAHLAIDFDITDLPHAAFVFPWRVWRGYRGGELDPATFGHGESTGAWFIQVNLVRDLLALRGQEVSDWDGWRDAAERDRDLAPDVLALCDRMAERIAAAPDAAPPPLHEAALSDFLATPPWKRAESGSGLYWKV